MVMIATHIDEVVWIYTSSTTAETPDIVGVEKPTLALASSAIDIQWTSHCDWPL